MWGTNWSFSCRKSFNRSEERGTICILCAYLFERTGFCWAAGNWRFFLASVLKWQLINYLFVDKKIKEPKVLSKVTKKEVHVCGKTPVCWGCDSLSRADISPQQSSWRKGAKPCQTSARSPGLFKFGFLTRRSSINSRFCLTHLHNVTTFPWRQFFSKLQAILSGFVPPQK